MIIKKAKEYLKTFDAKLVISGKENPIVYFFRAKNYYQMSDKQEVVVSSSHEDSQDMSAEDIKQWLDDGSTVETTFADEGQDGHTEL